MIEALQVDSNNSSCHPSWWYQMARIELMRGNHLEAFDAAQTALAIDPDHVGARSVLAENLTESIAQLDEYGTGGDDSTISVGHDQRIHQLWKDRTKLPDSDPALADLNLADLDVPHKFVVSTLIDAPIKSGFAWAISGANTTIVRPSDDPFWTLEARPKRGVLSRLFGRE